MHINIARAPLGIWLLFGPALSMPAAGEEATLGRDTVKLAACERQEPPCKELEILLHNVAARLRADRRLNEARVLYERAVETAIQTHGMNDPATAHALNGLALVQRDAGDFLTALATTERALSILRANNIGSGKEAAYSLLVRGSALRGMKRLVEARVCLERAARLREQIYGREDPLTAEAWISLAQLQSDFGNLRRAQSYYELALSTYADGTPSDQRPVVLNNIAALIARRHHWLKAAEMYRKSIAEWESSMGVEDPHVAIGLTNLSVLLIDRGRPEQARELLERAIEISQKRSPDDNAELGRELVTLAQVHAFSGDLPMALELSAKGLALLKTAWGSDDSRLLPSLDAHARLLHAQQDYGEAERIRLQATRIRVIHILRNSN